MLESTELRIEGEPSVEQALFIWKDSGVEFAECLIAVRHLELGCQAIASFDQRALELPAHDRECCPNYKSLPVAA